LGRVKVNMPDGATAVFHQERRLYQWRRGIFMPPRWAEIGHHHHIAGV
jgi:hypothetical protein